MTTLILASLLLPNQPNIERDPFGVPKVHAENVVEAYRLDGLACSQDRLWQMEMSRRQCRGKLAEVLGPAAERSDRQVLARAYTDTELQAQFDALPADVRAAFAAYSDGVNQDIADRTKAGNLPAGYKEYGFTPEPWTVLDSCAIVVRLARLFGTGGAGELRNLALLSYLTTQKVKGHELDVLDDLAWPNDRRSPTTVAGDGGPAQTIFGTPTRAATAAQFAAIPRPNLLELAGAIAMADQTDSKLLASHVGAPYKTGSYAVLVPRSKSATGNPLLLTAPQMGHATPSIIHEVAIDAPGLQVAGMEVPGIPGVAIGTSPQMAWGLTSGVADIEDVFWAPMVGRDGYTYDGKTLPIEKVVFNVKVKGRPDSTFTQLRTHHGPVLLLSSGAKVVFSLKSGLWKKELAMTHALSGLATAKTAADVDKAVDSVPTTFNLFYVTRDGHSGYRYVGHVPTRNPALDPRLPSEDTPANQWRPAVPRPAMPRLDDSPQGLISNWNNKSVAWWPNGDTPVWGRIFRVDTLRASLGKAKLTAFDLEKAAWDIARRDDTNGFFRAEIVRAVAKDRGRSPATEAEKQLAGWDGWSVQGSVGAEVYRECVRQLRMALFLKSIGNLTGEGLFVQAVQPSVIAEALDGKTKYDYLAGTTRDAVLVASFKAALAELAMKHGSDIRNWQYGAGSITVPGETPVPYINRGTYIQVTEFFPDGPMARSVASPGVSESGPHAFDQVPLARAWTFKPMWRW
ncbi:MAG: penicillin acylase family protein [Fimbriimonadaceae bacterium]|nr:penicillin acylase family protein [Fimbriimonadaceae bacterium]